MAYIAQRDGSRCGPFAAANVAEWLGVRAIDARFRLTNLCRLMKTDKSGTSCGDFTRVLRKLLKRYGCTVRLINNGVTPICRELDKNKIIVVTTRFIDYTDPCDHFYLITGRSGFYFRVINFYAKGRDRVESWIPLRLYEQLVQDKLTGTYTAVVTRYAK